MRFDLTDEEWALLESLMPKSRQSARVDDCKVMNAIFYDSAHRHALARLAGTLRPLHDSV
jgi:transposase